MFQASNDKRRRWRAANGIQRKKFIKFHGLSTLYKGSDSRTHTHKKAEAREN